MTILTCAQQFEMDGNPWLTERERAEMYASLTPTRGGRRLAKERPVHRDAPRMVRAMSEDELQRARQRDNLLAIRQMVSPPRREMKPMSASVLKREYSQMKDEKSPFERDFDADARRHAEFLEQAKRENLARRAKS